MALTAFKAQATLHSSTHLVACHIHTMGVVEIAPPMHVGRPEHQIRNRVVRAAADSLCYLRMYVRIDACIDVSSSIDSIVGR